MSPEVSSTLHATDLVASAGSPAEGLPLPTRRLVYAGLVAATVLALLAAMTSLLGAGGFSAAEYGMLAGFALTVPWNALNLWNAVIGFVLMRVAADPVDLVNPLLRASRGDEPVRLRVAMVMAVRNEGTDRVFRHLRLMEADLERRGALDAFSFFVLSDTDRPDVARREEERFAEWRDASTAAERLHYRRRRENTGYKAGNLREFCERWGHEHDIMIVLDADSLMSASALLRLTRVMQANPRLGILQTLTVGLPSRSLFARVFGYGLRQGMRLHTLGAAWWQGDCGSYWGHNAAIRLEPFIAHCRLPHLPGEPPLGGPVLSHDQIEAVLMRRAGYEVRVVPEEGGSYEESPPSVLEFIKRDLRWCQGNMQYLALLGLTDVEPAARAQMWTAILMYLGGMGWVTFIVFGLLQAFMPADVQPLSAALGQALFWLSMLLVLAPVLLGFADVLMRPEERERYGGASAVVQGAALSVTLSALLAPIVAVAQTVFLIGLAFGRVVRWDAQSRDTHDVPLEHALRVLRPQLFFGLAYGVALAYAAPGALLWAVPLLAPLLLAAPLTALTASREAGRAATASGLCALPEEIEPVPLVEATLRAIALSRGPVPARA